MDDSIQNKIDEAIKDLKDPNKYPGAVINTVSVLAECKERFKRINELMVTLEQKLNRMM